MDGLKDKAGTTPYVGMWFILAKDHIIESGRSKDMVIPRYNLGHVARERAPGVYILLFDYMNNLPMSSVDIKATEFEKCEFM